MSASRICAVVLRQIYLIRGSFARLMPLFAWVAVDMVLWGFLSRYLDSVAGGKFNFVGTLLGAILLWDFFMRVMQGITIAFFEDVWSRNFLNLFSTPLSIPEYLCGLILTSVASSLIALLAMLLLAVGAFGLHFLAIGWLLVPFLMILFAFGVAMGIAATAMVLRLGPSSEWFVWPIPGLVSPLVGVFYPISALPAWLRPVSRVLPPTYVFESLRAVVAGAAPPVGGIFSGAALAFVYLSAAAWIFSRTYSSAVRSGLIARYSAESVS